MKAFRRTAVLIGVVGVLVTACTSDPDEGAAGDTAGSDGPAAGSTRGITDDTIRIGFIGADLGALAQTGVVPDLGDQPTEVRDDPLVVASYLGTDEGAIARSDVGAAAPSPGSPPDLGPADRRDRPVRAQEIP